MGFRLFKIMSLYSFLILALFFCSTELRAQETAFFEEQKETKLPIPRFVSLGSEHVNLRSGPGTRYPIRFTISKEGLPVEVIGEFDVWRQIRDHEGDEGWVHKAMLSGKRTGFVRADNIFILNRPEDAGRKVALLEKGVIVDINQCDKKFCSIKILGYSGFVPQDMLWGVYPHENFK